jgi:leucyl aminopeptidase (aminopeptidase T)
LKLAPNEHFVIFDDQASQGIGDALAAAADGVGAWVRRFPLDRFAKRPLRSLPELARHALIEARASVFVASELHQETSVRQAILHLVREHSLRHAHLPGITERGFAAGIRIHYDELARLAAQLQRLLAGARTIFTESPAGTSLRVTLDEGARWFAQLGVVAPGNWANFPAGAFYASPARVDGVFVADASLGEFFGARAGLLSGHGARLTVDDSRVVDVVTQDAELLRDVRATLEVAANSERIGLIAIGMNPGIAGPIGEWSIDQNVPGLHLGIGDPAGRSSGATWRAQTCFAACQARSTVTVDGIVVVRDGVLVGHSGVHRPSRTGPRVTPPRSMTPVPTR